MRVEFNVCGLNVMSGVELRFINTYTEMQTNVLSDHKSRNLLEIQKLTLILQQYSSNTRPYGS